MRISDWSSDVCSSDLKGDFLAKPAAVSDKTIAAALADARTSGDPAINLRAIEKAESDLHDWRKRADGAVAKPLADRPKDVLDGYVPGLGRILNDLIPVLNAIDAAIARADSDVATPITIARLAADLRATGSIRGTTTVNVVASGKPIPPIGRAHV